MTAPDAACQCWVGHGSCGGCSGYTGIKHEPACGYEYNPNCPVHGQTAPDADAKWRIEKCRRGRNCWHVYPPSEPGDIFCPDYEFRTGAEALSFVKERLSA